MLSSDSEVMMSVCTSFSLTSAFPSRRRAAESSSSSSRTQDLMLPPSLRSRNRSAGHLAPRRPIPPKLRRVCLVPVSCAGRSCEVRADKYPRLCHCLEAPPFQVFDHRDSRTGETSQSVRLVFLKTRKRTHGGYAGAGA